MFTGKIYENTKVETIDFKSDTLYLSMDDIDRNFDNAFDAKGFKVTPFEEELIGIGMRLDIIQGKGSAINLVKEAKKKEELSLTAMAEKNAKQALIQKLYETQSNLSLINNLSNQNELKESSFYFPLK